MEELYQAHIDETYIRDQTDECFEYDYYEEPVILYDKLIDQIILNPENPRYEELLAKSEDDILFQTKIILLNEDGFPNRSTSSRKAIYQAWCYAQTQTQTQTQTLKPSGG